MEKGSLTSMLERPPSGGQPVRPSLADPSVMTFSAQLCTSVERIAQHLYMMRVLKTSVWLLPPYLGTALLAHML